MVIYLSFSHNKEIMNFAVKDREIYYKDRIWKGGIRCIPKDEEFIKKILLSRNVIPNQLVRMFDLSAKDKEEYDSCKTEKELAEKIISDCKKQGLILISIKNTKEE